jgi:hypothetical protein
LDEISKPVVVALLRATPWWSWRMIIGRFAHVAQLTEDIVIAPLAAMRWSASVM